MYAEVQVRTTQSTNLRIGTVRAERGEFYLLVVRATSVCKLTHPEKRHKHCIIRFRYTRPAPYRTLRFPAQSRDDDCPN